MSNEQKEQAREIVEANKRLADIRRWSRVQASMEETAARNGLRPIESKSEGQLRSDIDCLLSALSSRDAEVKQVLEGLATHQIGSRRPCWCPLDYGSEPHTPACLAARDLYSKLQGS